MPGRTLLPPTPQPVPATRTPSPRPWRQRCPQCSAVHHGRACLRGKPAQPTPGIRSELAKPYHRRPAEDARKFPRGQGRNRWIFSHCSWRDPRRLSTASTAFPGVRSARRLATMTTADWTARSRRRRPAIRPRGQQRPTRIRLSPRPASETWKSAAPTRTGSRWRNCRLRPGAPSVVPFSFNQMPTFCRKGSLVGHGQECLREHAVHLPAHFAHGRHDLMGALAGGLDPAAFQTRV